MSKILVGSLQYSPIYKSHCCAFGKQCEKHGHTVKYLFSQDYEWMLDEETKKKTVFIGKSNSLKYDIFDGLNFQYYKIIKSVINQEKPSYIYMHNYHPFFNYHIAKISEKNGIQYIQHIHEPYVENKKVYGGIHQYWLYLFEHFQGVLLKKTKIAIISSDEAERLFNIRYPSYKGKILKIPLMYEDQYKDKGQTEARKYITFVGPPYPAKGPETLLAMAQYSEQHNLDDQFLLISRQKVTDPAYTKGNIEIYYHDRISDQEMSTLLSSSLASLTPYKSARQSSVVLTSFMCGTPVLATGIEGLKESVEHGRTGYLVSPGAPVETWIEGLQYIKNHFPELSANCRNKFVSESSEINWPKYFGDLFGSGGL